MSRKRLSIEDANDIAQQKGGKCLSETYVRAQANLDWECARGHVWSASMANVRNKGSWCSKCATSRRVDDQGLEKAQAIAESKNGKCLALDYKGCKARVQWQCSEGHEWFAPFASVIHLGTWCPSCARANLAVKLRNPRGLEEAQIKASSQGGQCISETYLCSAAPLRWRCSEGHEWKASYNNVCSNDYWCPTCGYASMADTQRNPRGLEEARAAAATRGGACLSESYVSCTSPLLWECGEKKHLWKSSYSSVVTRGSWCPSCPLKSENACRVLCETLTGFRFIKCRPKWLGGLELDGYCEELEIGFEFNGEQHYHLLPYFHRNGLQDLEAQQRRDHKTQTRCNRAGVILIVIRFDDPDPEKTLESEFDLLGVLT